MKYYLVNKEEIKSNVFANPIVIKTNSLPKIYRMRLLQKQLNKLKSDIIRELQTNNAVKYNPEILESFLDNQGDEITRSDYNKLYGSPLYDTRQQRIDLFHKTEILRFEVFQQTE